MDQAAISCERACVMCVPITNLYACFRISQRGVSLKLSQSIIDLQHHTLIKQQS